VFARFPTVVFGAPASPLKTKLKKKKKKRRERAEEERKKEWERRDDRREKNTLMRYLIP